MTKIEKDEEQIAKDKDAIAKMVGAKSAMEAAIRRIEGLTSALKRVQNLHEEAAKVFSPHARVLTHYNGANCMYSQEKKTIAVDDITAAIAAIVHQQTSANS